MSDIKRYPGNAKGRCRAVEHNGYIWVVGVGAGDTVTEQTHNMLALVEKHLNEAGSNKHRILETTIYLTDMSKKDDMDAIWCDWIPDDGWPCRACVGTDLAPGDLVEIKLIAAKV